MGGEKRKIFILPQPLSCINVDSSGHGRTCVSHTTQAYIDRQCTLFLMFNCAVTELLNAF